jgi:hypothetical protein
MVARIKREPDELVVRFERSGEDPRRKIARGGRQALFLAVGMLIEHTRLMAGDRLTVSAPDGEAETLESQ